jgi:hypothetical protein
VECGFGGRERHAVELLVLCANSLSFVICEDCFTFDIKISGTNLSFIYIGD